MTLWTKIDHLDLSLKIVVMPDDVLFCLINTMDTKQSWIFSSRYSFIKRCYKTTLIKTVSH